MTFRLHGFYPYSAMKNVERNPDEYLYCACVWGCSKKKEYYDHLLALCCKYGAKLVTTNHPADTMKKLKEIGKRL